MNKYQMDKERIRAIAIDFSNASEPVFTLNGIRYTYEDVPAIQDFFRKQARRYGLVKEFEENGII